MMTAGIPLVQSFDIVGAGHENPAMQKLILAIKGDVEGGTALADALGKHPLHFDDLFVSLVAAGEQAGALETLLDKIATYKEKTEAIKKKIKKALFYPAAVVVVAIVVTAILMIYVIPEFESLFQGFGADLPAFTRFVIDISKFVQIDGLVAAHRRRRRHLGFPLRQEAQSRRAAFRRSRNAEAADHRLDPAQVGDRALRAHAVDDVRGRRAARRGARLRGRRLRQHRLRRRRPAHARRSRHGPTPAARDGEHRPVPEHGQPDDRRRRRVGLARRHVGKVADFYEEEVDNAVDSMSSLLEPLIMAILGVLVGGLVIAMYLPIFKMGAVV